MPNGNIITMNTQQVWKILETIPDPEIPVITIIELGIVKDVIQNENQTIVKITPTYSGCPAMDQIEKDIISNLHAAGIKNVLVEKIYSPAWTTDWITAEAKAKLMAYGISPPALVSANKKALLSGEQPVVICPQCKSRNTVMISQFGSTACKALYKCLQCLEPFDHFKCL
jgi:ring-1,2-phenylacetyl-CoA epoxidase subunit PaaD